MSGARQVLTAAEIAAAYADGQGMVDFARRIEALVLSRAIIWPGGYWEFVEQKNGCVVVSARIPKAEWLAYLKGRGTTE